MRSGNLKFYSKGVALGLALTVTVLLLMNNGSTVSGVAGVFIEHGYDHFTTPGDGNTYHNFTDGPIPAGLFNTPGSGGSSNAYSGAVPLKGVPIQGQGGADTIISRNDDVITPGMTTLTVVGLSLASINPLTITFSDSHTEQWNMTVGLSQIQASTGTMTLTDTGPSSGTFNSSLTIIPRFTFTRVSDGTVRVWDTGSGGKMSSALETSRQDALAQAAAPIKPCPVIITPDSPNSKTKVAPAAASQAVPDATGGAARITLNSRNTPWTVSNGKLIIPVPPTEEDRWRKHQPSPTPTPCYTQTSTQ